MRTNIFYNLVNWLFFIAICLIWGSSFILMKLGLYDASGNPLLSFTQVAALRIATAGVTLIPLLIRNIRSIPLRYSWIMILSGVLGSFLPAFLFCLAETKLDSSLVGTLNAMTPIFTLVLSFLLFGSRIRRSQTIGIAIGFAGIIFLFVLQKHTGIGQAGYGILILLATFSYAMNILLVNKYLQGVSAILITAFSLATVTIPSIVILGVTGFFSLPLLHPAYLKACLAACSLGILSTGIAWVLFYLLVKRAGVLFTSTTSYGLPFVAFGWSWLYGEQITSGQVGCLLFILGGVYLTRLSS